jgi:hypothetical protein
MFQKSDTIIKQWDNTTIQNDLAHYILFNLHIINLNCYFVSFFFSKLII